MDSRHHSLVLLVIVNLAIPISCQFPLYPYQDTGYCILSMEIPVESHQYNDYIVNFFGMRFEDYEERYYITVYPDGVLAVGPFQQNFVFTSNNFPLTGEGTTLIAPFMADVDLSLSGKVWLSDIYDYRDDILSLVQATFPDANVEYINYLYAVTWENVSFFGSTTNSTNTFQATVFTAYSDFVYYYYYYYGDGDYGDEYYSNYQTYVIFNYGQLTWSTGTNEGGDGNGLGGIPAQVGFNAGDGENYFTLPGSRTNEVLDLQMSSNIGIPGRWLFRVDEETIQGFSCRDKGRIGLAPSSGVMVGGTKVTIVGPCYSPDSEVVCKFGNVTVPGNLVEGGVSEIPDAAVCVSPDCLQVGPVLVEVSLNGGQTYPFYGNFRYLSLSSVEPDVSRMDPNNWLPCTNAQDTYTITWDAASLPNINNVDIDVIGYCEPEVGNPSLTVLYQAGTVTDVNTNGRVFTINCASLPPSPCGESECNKIGAIRVRSSAGTIRPAIWSDFFPLKWLCGEPCSCATWLESQAELSLNSQPCPCTLAQAQRDRGRFQPITGCDCEDDDPNQCLGRCAECFRATLVNFPCGGHDCCYDISSGALLTDCGGFLYQAHQDGCAPFKSPGKVPWLSHLLLDVYPWYQCCRWEDELSCIAFKEVRRGPSCAGYIPPRPAACSGDPHIMTFDGNLYTFNGHGEFTMVEVGDGEVVMQARNLPTTNGRASVIKAVGICVTDSDGLHVEVRPGGLNAWVRDGTEWELADFQISATQPYTGFEITKGKNEFFESPETLTITYGSGLGLYFNGDTGTEGVISVISTGIQPSSSTKGLLGTWNQDPEDDFMDADGNFFDVTSTPEELHQFGISWEVDDSESCFYYRPEETHDGFTDLSFSPDFEPENPSITPEMIEEVCGFDAFCAFDLRATGDPALAANTASSLAMAMSVSEANEEAGTPCPPLANPANGIVVIDDATVGGTATYSCNQGFSLTGNMIRVCRQSSTWSGSDPECVVLPPLSCIVQRPSVGIKEDVSVFIYGLPGSQTTPDAVKLRRGLKNENGLRVPPSKERTVGQGTLCEIPLPSTQRGGRFGVFACETIDNGYVTNSVKAVVTSARKSLLPVDGRVTRTVNIGEKVHLRVTLPNGPLCRLRWIKDLSWQPQWYRRPAVTLKSATLKDEGVYEIFQRGRRNRGLQAIIILYVRACPKGFYGSNCNQPCNCQNGGLCDESTGECTCPPGFTGSSCEETYTVGICSNVFGIPEAKGCRGVLFCKSGKFGCICGPGYFGIDCEKECPYGTYGAGCTQTCDGYCNSRTGE